MQNYGSVLVVDNAPYIQQTNALELDQFKQSLEAIQIGLQLRLIISEVTLLMKDQNLSLRRCKN